MADLDALLDVTRRDRPVLPDALTARILADAESEQDRFARRKPKAAPVWHRWLEVIGGWPAMGGMATACAAGIWIGFAPPQMLPDPALLVQVSDFDLFADDDLLIALTEDDTNDI